MAFDPWGVQTTKVMSTVSVIATGGIGLAIFTAPSSNMFEQAAAATVIGVSIWAIAKMAIKGQ